MSKPTKEEMQTAIKNLNDRVKDKAYNGEDKEKDRLKKLQDEEIRKSKSFEVFKDNKKELDKFMKEYNMVDIYKFTVSKYLVHYEFGSYKIIGKTPQENQQDILDKHKLFLDMTHLTKLNLTDIADFSYLGYPNLVCKARRIRDQYISANKDTRCFIPEFLFGVPMSYVDEFFLTFFVINNLCDGLLDKNMVPDDITDRLRLKAYPVIYLDRENGKQVSDQIKSIKGFMDSNTQYLSY